MIGDGMRRRFTNTEYIIESDRLPAGFSGLKIVMLSDLHGNSYKLDLDEMINTINSIKPDCIVCAGDMITGKPDTNYFNMVDFFEKLCKGNTVFYANGNHEYRMKLFTDTYGDMYYMYRDKIAKAGVNVLENETVILEKEDVSFSLTGLEIDSIFYSKRHRVTMGSGYLYKELGDRIHADYSIMLAHNPKYFQQYAEWGADLVLSGHIHGGIIRFPGLGGLISTDFTLFPKYDSGLYNEYGSNMILSRGLGSHTVNIRINNQPELITVKILAKQD